MAKSTFTDIDAAFIKNPISKDIAIKTDARAISFAIKNLLMTINGERPFNEQIGSPLKGLLFELHGPQLKIVLNRIIAETITNFEPRAKLIDVSINDSADNNLLYVSITYMIINTQQPITIGVTLERSR